MTTVYPDETVAGRVAFCPSPAEDDGANPQRRVFSATKYMAMIDEIIALGAATYVPVYNDSGSALPAGPVAINGYHFGDGYEADGAVILGATPVTSILLKTGSAPINIGDPFTIAGNYKNTQTPPGLQVFTATTALTGAGTLEFTPPLTDDVADGAAVTVNQGFTVELPVHIEAAFVLLEELDNECWGIAYRQGDVVSALDTSGAAIGDPVYYSAAGALTLAAPAAATNVVQVVGRVKTLDAVAGVVALLIEPATTIGGAQIGAGAILNANVGAAAAIAGTKISPDFGSQNLVTTGSATIGDGLVLSPSTSKLIFATGSNKQAGEATLVAGAVTVANTTIASGSIVLLSRKTIGGTPGNLSYVLNTGSDFEIHSDNAADTSVVAYVLVKVS